ncbi:GNAT family N-acetyltransferase [Acetobacteraceae bacterium H6797]|nr:GNAT family N-acetyltransferase [Acetobacteraceae bacterium H6797]
MTLVVRRPTAADAPGLAALFAEMQRHYQQPVPDTLAEEAASFLCAPCAGGFEPRTVIAIDDGTVIGSAVLNVTFPAAELSRSLYIRDLYVSSGTRRRGVGRALLKEAAAITVAEGFSALDWTTDAANLVAHRLYDGRGAKRVGRIYFRLTGKDLVRVATGPLD